MCQEKEAKSMTIAKLQQFLAVCQFQSVSRAAEFLHISQPSVSGTIRDLESEFQINLFRHEGRRLVLTAEGSFLRERAQTLIRQFDELSWQGRSFSRSSIRRSRQRIRKSLFLLRNAVPSMRKSFWSRENWIWPWPRSRRLLLRNFPVRSLRGHSWCSASVLPIAWPGRKQSM